MSIMNQDKIAYTKSDFLILSHRNIIIVSKKHQIKLLFSNSVSKRSKSSGKANTRKMFYFPTSTPKPWVAGSNPPAPAKSLGRFRSDREKTRKAEISRDFSAFFAPNFF